MKKIYLCYLWVSLASLIPLALSAQPEVNPVLKPFYHGVASGDPLSDRVIIWTRVTPENDQPVEVTWMMASDVEMNNLVAQGTFTTDASRDYTVKVDVDGLMEGTTYYYQFKAMGAYSIIGRTHTAPAGPVNHLRFAVVSCSNYQAGYFTAYKKIAERADLDAVIHLGDYIYEYSATGEDFYGNEDLRNAGKRLHYPDKELLELQDYRDRYAQYRLDPDLMEAHQQHPFITVWDDHESANDAYKDGAENHNPGEGEWSERKAISRQAYSEWIPIRGDLNTIPLYRTIKYGDLMDLIMIDTRLEAREEQEMSVLSPELYAADRTLLGATQKQWLKDQLSDSEATWKIIGNQVIFSDFNVWWAASPTTGTPDQVESIFLDIWDGYPKERDELIQYLIDNEIDNTVILTGDFHSSFAYDVALEPVALTGGNELALTTGSVPVPVTPTYDPASSFGSVAVEFATPSVTSANFDENLDPATAAGLEAQINNPISAPGLPFDGLNPNPTMKYNDLDRHGYYILDVKSNRVQANFYYVDDILIPDSDESFDQAWGTDLGNNYLTQGDENDPKENPPALAPDFMADNFTLQLLHASDLEGGVDAIDNAPNFAAIIDQLEEEAVNTLLISAGDNYIPGPFFGAAGNGDLRPVYQSVYQDLLGEPGLTNIREGDGRVDITIMNILGFDASAIGNHEFDAGPNAFEGLINSDIRGATLGDIRWLGARFPYLSSNLDFSNEPDLAGIFTDQLLPNTDFIREPGSADPVPRLAPATLVEFNGEYVGVIGATTQLLESITSNGNVEVIGPNEADMQALADIIQPIVDQMTADGIDKIVVVSHLQQFALEQELIGLLTDVDIVIAGGSDALLAQPDDPLFPGDVPVGDYPLVTTNAAGQPAALVGIPGEYSYVGRLVVEFDANGVLIPTSLDNPESGVYAALPDVVDNLWGGNDPFAAGTKGELVQRLTSAVEAIVTAQDGNIFGQTTVFLEGRREQVRTEETNLGNLTADANLAIAQQFDPEVLVSLKNGGGIRAAIGQIIDLGGGNVEFAPTPANPDAGKAAGEISQLDITNSLRFNNGLTLLTLTAQQLYEVIEHGVSASGPGNTPGQFPQVGGMEFSFDVNLPAGDRVQSLEIVDDMGNVIDQVVENGELVGDPSRTIRIVTLNFLAGGGDGYPFPTDAAANRVNLYEQALPDGNATFATAGTEQDALAEFLYDNYQTTPFDKEETPIPQDERIVQIAELADVFNFLLVKAPSGEVIQPLMDGAIITNAVDVNITADIAEIFTSVQFELEGPVHNTQIENVSPYAVFGDRNGVFRLATLTSGAYTLTATPYMGRGASGVAGKSVTVTFQVENEPEFNFRLVEASTGEIIQFLEDGEVLNQSTDINLVADITDGFESLKFELDGPTSVNRTENFEPYALFGDNNGSFFGGTLKPGNYHLTVTPFSEANAMGTAGQAGTLAFTVEDAFQVTNLRLVDASTGQWIADLSDHLVIDGSQLPVEVTVIGDAPNPDQNSISFDLDGPLSTNQLENVVPFTLFGDRNGNLNGRSMPSGDYSLSADIWEFKNRKGKKGTPVNVSFSIVGGNATASRISAYPVPFERELNIRGLQKTGDMQLELTHIHGRRFAISADQIVESESGIRVTTQGLPPGHYILRITQGNQMYSYHVIKE